VITRIALRVVVAILEIASILQYFNVQLYHVAFIRGEYCPYIPRVHVAIDVLFSHQKLVRLSGCTFSPPEKRHIDRKLAEDYPLTVI
jgi:hypothetical protein